MSVYGCNQRLFIRCIGFEHEPEANSVPACRVLTITGKRSTHCRRVHCTRTQPGDTLHVGTWRMPVEPYSIGTCSVSTPQYDSLPQQVCSVCSHPMIYCSEAARASYYLYLVPVAKLIESFKRVMISLVDEVGPSWNAARTKIRTMDARRKLNVFYSLISYRGLTR